MIDRANIGTVLPIGGSGNPKPLPFDLTMNYPRRIVSISAIGTFQTTPGAWLEVAGSFTGAWTFKPEGANVGPSIPLLRGACFPAPRDGVVNVDAIGTGTVYFIEWPPEIGARVATGRGYAPPASVNGASAANATRVITSTDQIKYNDTVVTLAPSAGSLGITLVNRATLADGSANTHVLIVGSQNTITTAGVGGTSLAAGQSYSFGAGQTVYYIPDADAAQGTTDMIVEISEAF